VEEEVKTGGGRRPPHIRLFFILFLALVFFWLPIEDTHVFPAQVVGALGSALAIAGWYWRLSCPAWSRIQAAAAGLVAGLAAPAAAALLLILKIGLHGHSRPDFSLQDIVDLLSRTPIWMVGGALIGAGIQPFLPGSKGHAGS